MNILLVSAALIWGTPAALGAAAAVAAIFSRRVRLALKDQFVGL